MDSRRKYYKGPSNVVYNIDGASFGMDDRLVDAITASIRAKLERNALVIPRLPHVAGRILQLSQNAEVPVGEVTKAIMSDPVLAARVLSIANSAAYAATGQVDGLDAALTRLGMKNVCNIVFAESVQTKVFPARAYRELLDRSWRLSLGSAVACDASSRATGLEREGAFLLGLLHDIGKPTLVNAITECERKNDGRPLGEELVEIVLSQLHEEIGGHVLEQWGMPAGIVEGAQGHHRYPMGAKATPSQKIVYAANLICRHLGVGEEACGVSFNLEQVFLDLGLAEPGRIEKVLEKVAADVESLLEGFGGMTTTAA
jgi:HD-like signal output (HDOD) protein